MKRLTEEQKQLCAQWLELAWWTVRRYYRGTQYRRLWPELDDCAVDTLVRAAAAFDPQRGVKFSTYATWAIRKNLRRAVARNLDARRCRTRDPETLVTVVDPQPRPGHHLEEAEATAARLAAVERAGDQDCDRGLWRRWRRGSTVEALAANYGVTTERIRQRLRRIRDRIRATVEAAA